MDHHDLQRMIGSDVDPSSPGIVAHLRALATSRDERARRRACLAASALGRRELLRDVLERIDDEVRSVAQAAVTALREWPDAAEVVTALRASSAPREARVRRLRALEAAALLEEPRVIPVLIDRLADPDVSTAARRALIRLTAHDAGARPDAWRVWLRDNRHRPRAAWLADALESDTLRLRTVAARQLGPLLGVKSLEHVAAAPPLERARARRFILEQVGEPARDAA